MCFNSFILQLEISLMVKLLPCGKCELTSFLLFNLLINPIIKIHVNFYHKNTIFFFVFPSKKWIRVKNLIN